MYCFTSLTQVLRKRLSLVEPTIRTEAGFEYEEGEGLDEDEVGTCLHMRIRLCQA